MEVTTHLFRALANATRIRILRLLTVLGEQPVLALADALDAPVNAVSVHLGKLAAAGFVWRRRSGRTVYYRVAERPSNPIVRTASVFLSDVFAAVTTREPKAVARAEPRDKPTCSDAALFALFTAFTHPRRLQIIRRLSQHGATTTPTLSEALSMSEDAVHRHLSKLRRRGLVQSARVGVYVVHRVTIDEAWNAAGLVHTVIEDLARREAAPHTAAELS